MGKILNQKIFDYFFWRPLGSRVRIEIHFFLQVHFKLSAFDTSGNFAAGIDDTGGKFSGGGKLIHDKNP